MKKKCAVRNENKVDFILLLKKIIAKQDSKCLFSKVFCKSTYFRTKVSVFRIAFFEVMHEFGE